jgi:hypothetical protein
MSVIRVQKTKDYTVMSNTHFREKNMSLKAKGLLSLMLSLPDDWDYSVEGLIAICKESGTAIKSTLKELKEFGYLKVEKTQNEKGVFEYIYNIYENPQTGNPPIENPSMDNPPMDNPPMENPSLENELQLNTEESITKKVNTKRSNTKRSNTKDIDVYFPLDEKLNESFKDYIEYRKSIRKPLTGRGIELAIKKLNSLTSDNDIKIEIINQSIMSRWTGLFPLKKEHTSSGSTYIDAINNRMQTIDKWLEEYKNND